MRGELVRLVFSLCLIGGAFLGGLYVGWRRWGMRDDDAVHGVRFTSDAPFAGDAAFESRRDLFAPANGVVDLRSGTSALPRRSASPGLGQDRSLPRASIVPDVISADEIIGTRRERDPRRVE